ncbi:MAG: hypothetical protein MK031_00360 [Alphaproteobacteria bacterium]|nr:hypothetical protein [Alphaproteobacteria bacterium]
MIGSRVDLFYRVTIALTVVISTCVISNLAALGQEANNLPGPVSLVPKVEVTKPRPSKSFSSQVKPEITIKSVQVSETPDRLPNPEVSQSSIGEVLVGQKEDKIDENFWKGISQESAVRLISSIPNRLRSSAANNLARRILLMNFYSDYNSEGSVSLLRLRLEKLISMGALQDASLILDELTNESVKNALVEQKVSVKLLTSNLSGACQLVREFETGFVSEFGQKLVVFCQLLNMEYEGARRGLELLSEQNLVADEIFFELSNSIISGKPPALEVLNSPGKANALNLAMIRVVGAQVPHWFASSESPSLLKAIATTSDASRQSRLMAIRRAAKWGALSPEEIANVYIELGITEDEIVEVLLEPGNASAGLRLAVIYLASISDDMAISRAEGLQQMWYLAKEYDEWHIAVKLTSSKLNLIKPSSSLLWFASDAISANLAVGQNSQALEWFREISSVVNSDPDADVTYTKMWPSLRLAYGKELSPNMSEKTYNEDEKSLKLNHNEETENSGRKIKQKSYILTKKQLAWNNQKLSKWIAIQEEEGPGGAKNIANMLALFDALGEPLAKELWLRANTDDIEKITFPSLEVHFGLKRAAESGSVAETAFYTLSSIGEGDVFGLHPIAIHTIIESLKKVGLHRTARAIALEISLNTNP